MKKKHMSTKKKIMFGIILLILLICGTLFYFKVYKIRGIPFVQRQTTWSIGMYEGNPLSLKPIKNITYPVLEARSITDINAEFVADPFIIKKDKTYYLFFEALNKDNGRGEIGVAVSDNALDWKYEKIVLRENFHLSYPYVFEWNNSYYLIPESAKSKSVRLYKATNYPYEWEHVKDILVNNDYTDPSLVYYNNVWYMFTTTNRGCTLRLFFSDSLEGNWVEHPMSPIYVNNTKYSRGAGRIIRYGSSLIRYAQDDEFDYGTNVYALNITVLNTTTYNETLLNVSVLDTSDYGWNEDGMHQIDALKLSANKWIAAVDGKRKHIAFGLDY